MATPVIVSCTEGAWKKVATNVLTGSVKKLNASVNYLETYRPTGDPAPTLITEGVIAFEGSSKETISASSGIDVYIWAIGGTGSVRVDV